jgi:hypothetical protein
MLPQLLKKNLRDLQARLQLAYERADQAAKLKEQPILYTKEFLALNNKQVHQQ